MYGFRIQMSRLELQVWEEAGIELLGLTDQQFQYNYGSNDDEPVIFQSVK